MNTDDRATVRSAVAIALLLTVAGLGAAGFTLAAPDGPSGETVLNETRERYAAAETLTVDATVTVSNETVTEAATVSAVAARDNRSRLIVEDGNRSIVVGSNGTVGWTFVPATGVTTIYREETATTIGPLGDATTREYDEAVDDRYDYAEPTEPARLNWSAENRSVERVETVQYEGSEVHVVSITHADASVDGEARLWVRTADSVVVKQRVRTPNATVVVDVEETRFDVSVADSTFQPPTADDGAAGLTPVDSVEELDDDAPFRAVGLDAAGFDFERGVVSRIGAADGTTALSRYANGSTTVTVVQTDASSLPTEVENVSTTTESVDGRSVTVAERDGRAVAWWTADGTTVAVSGELSRERLLDLVGAVERVSA